MRKTSAVLLICLVLTSCVSNKGLVITPDAVITEPQAAYALEHAIEKAQEKTAAQLYFSIAETNLIPKSYKMMEDNASFIPGLKPLLDKSTKTLSDLILKILENGIPYTEDLISQLIFNDATRIVEMSETSATDFFRSHFHEEVREMVAKGLEDADFSSLEQARVLHNVYTGMMNYMNGTDTQKIDTIDYKSYYTNLATDIYFNTLAKCEFLVRTTPDPYQDSYITQVLGNW